MSDVESFVRFCESEFGSAVVDREAAYVKEQVTLDDRILDVGCGIGSLEERFAGYDIVGVDRSMEMVRTARDRALAPVVRGDARKLPIATGAVDAVVFVATLSFIQAVGAALSEAVRVLDPGGTVVVLALNTRSEYVQSNLARDGSYFRRMVHRDTEELASRVLEYVDGTREYLLGVDGETIVERTDPETAAITAIVGSPSRPPP
ncbi:class I SAM-dependent methyltransferase [Haloplanus salilacus]|uniref:class I SAM-dependent methyltransferase n=1 Tax=Haloplanus salilacus TaxID=2949994 RepID=UPI0030CDE7CC